MTSIFHTQYYYENGRAKSVDITIEIPNKTIIVLEHLGMYDLDLFRHYALNTLGTSNTCLKRISKNKAIVENLEYDLTELLIEIPNILVIFINENYIYSII